MTTLIAAPAGAVDTDQIDLSDLGMGGGWTATTTRYSLETYGGPFDLIGSGFTYDLSSRIGAGAAPALTGGVVTGLHEPGFAVDGFSIPATTMSAWVGAYPEYAFNLAAFAGDDSLAGGGGNDLLRGDTGNDTVSGGGGDDLLDGGAAARPSSSGVPPDPARDGNNYLRGDEGNDSIIGGAGFDDINGNAGNDTVHGNRGDDWVLGGRDNDVLFGDDGSDLLNGNLGADTIDGGAGADSVHGGQGDDSVSGGLGDDLVLGDLGADTMSGGGGADVFVIGARSSDASSGAADRIIDWSPEDRFAGLSDTDALLYYEVQQSTSNYDDALRQANDLMLAGPAVDIVAVAIGQDVAIFIDVDGDDASGVYAGEPARTSDDAADLAIILVGRSLADISAANFGASDGDPHSGAGAWDY